MSVTCILHEASDEQIAELLESPEKIHAFLKWDPPRQSWWDKFLGRKFELPADFELPFFDLGKSWEAIHYVLTGTKEKIKSPLSFLISGGRYIGEEDIRYEPGRALISTLVRKVSRALEPIPFETFRARINLVEMQKLEVYGAPFPDEPQMLQYFIDDYIKLREYLFKLNSRNHGLIIQYV